MFGQFFCYSPSTCCTPKNYVFQAQVEFVCSSESDHNSNPLLCPQHANAKSRGRGYTCSQCEVLYLAIMFLARATSRVLLSRLEIARCITNTSTNFRSYSTIPDESNAGEAEIAKSTLSAQPSSYPGPQKSSKLMQSLVDARVHLGHKAGVWNQKMAPYILGSVRVFMTCCLSTENCLYSWLYSPQLIVLYFTVSVRCSTRAGVHIIDLDETVFALQKALKVIRYFAGFWLCDCVWYFSFGRLVCWTIAIMYSNVSSRS